MVRKKKIGQGEGTCDALINQQIEKSKDLQREQSMEQTIEETHHIEAQVMI